MSKSAVAVREPAGELTPAEELEAELVAANQAEADSSDFQIPLLKIGHGQTKEVQEGDAAQGEFINSLTGVGIGRELEFIVAGTQKSRFDHGERGVTKARRAHGSKIVPWSDDPFHGRPFTEHPDAEEQYSKRVNNNEIPWGKGPRISTTYDFIGYVVPDEDEPAIPVCLSLMRKNKPQAKKLLTILDAVLRGRYWDVVFTLTTELQRNDDGSYYTINIKQGRKTTPDEKLLAMQLASQLRKQQAQFAGEAEETAPTVEPDAKGGMDV